MKLLKTLKQSKLRKVKGGVMDIQKELESFKTVAIAKGWSIDGETTQTNYRFYSLQTNSGWEMWQAKAQAVPEGFVLVPVELSIESIRNLDDKFIEVVLKDDEDYQDIYKAMIEAQEQSHD